MKPYDFGYTTIEGVALRVNEGEAQGFEHLTSEFLAASYAADAAITGADDITQIDADTIDAHLEFLSEAGANFNTQKAINIALDFVGQHKD